MAIVTDKVIAVAATTAGFTGDEIPVAVAVALAESGGDATATNRNNNGSTDYGLWQINSVHDADLKSGDWKKPLDNAKMARAVYIRAGRSWTPWVAYKNGSYSKFLGRGKAVQNARAEALEGFSTDLAWGILGQTNPLVSGAQTALSAADTAWNAVSKFFGAIFDTDTWRRIGFFVLGGLLLILAAAGLLWAMNPAKVAAKAVGLGGKK